MNRWGEFIVRQWKKYGYLASLLIGSGIAFVNIASIDALLAMPHEYLHGFLMHISDPFESFSRISPHKAYLPLKMGFLLNDFLPNLLDVSVAFTIGRLCLKNLDKRRLFLLGAAIGSLWNTAQYAVEGIFHPGVQGNDFSLMARDLWRILPGKEWDSMIPALPALTTISALLLFAAGYGVSVLFDKIVTRLFSTPDAPPVPCPETLPSF